MMTIKIQFKNFLFRQEFLEVYGYQNASINMIAGDASFRKYYRLSHSNEVTILMDAPPPEEDTTSFVAIAKHLCDIGFSAPDVIAMDRVNGFLILSDLGDDSFNRLVTNDPDLEQTLYENAVDLLVDLHTKTVSPSLHVEGGISYSIGAYNSDVMLTEARLLPSWTMASIVAQPVDCLAATGGLGGD